MGMGKQREQVRHGRLGDLRLKRLQSPQKHLLHLIGGGFSKKAYSEWNSAEARALFRVHAPRRILWFNGGASADRDGQHTQSIVRVLLDVDLLDHVAEFDHAPTLDGRQVMLLEDDAYLTEHIVRRGHHQSHETRLVVDVVGPVGKHTDEMDGGLTPASDVTEEAVFHLFVVALPASPRLRSIEPGRHLLRQLASQDLLVDGSILLLPPQSPDGLCHVMCSFFLDQ